MDIHIYTVEPRKPDTEEYTLFFFEVQELAKLIYGDRGQNSGYL